MNTIRYMRNRNRINIIVTYQEKVQPTGLLRINIICLRLLRMTFEITYTYTLSTVFGTYNFCRNMIKKLTQYLLNLRMVYVRAQ